MYCRHTRPAPLLHTAMAELDDVKKQLQDKSLELEKEIALRKLLNSQKDEQAKRLRHVEQQLEQMAATTKSESVNLATADGSRLLKLLREAEMRNEELTAKLHDTESELQSMKLSHLRLETANSARVAAQSATLMERLSSAQREREKVLTSQLRTALKERQDALGMASALQQENRAENAKNTELQQIFEEMRGAKDSFLLQKQGAILVEKVKALKEEYETNIRDKLLFLKSEKEAAETRAQALAMDIAQLKRRLEMTETEYKLVDKTRVKALQTQLLATVAEKEEWEMRAHKLEDTIETLQIVNTLQRSLRKEDDIKQKYELELQKCQAQNDALTGQLNQLVQERNVAIVERNHIVQERNSLAITAQQEYERAEQLQRIVTVLRKKARSTSTSSENPP